LSMPGPSIGLNRKVEESLEGKRKKKKTPPSCFSDLNTGLPAYARGKKNAKKEGKRKARGGILGVLNRRSWLFTPSGKVLVLGRAQEKKEKKRKRPSREGRKKEKKRMRATQTYFMLFTLLALISSGCGISSDSGRAREKEKGT